MAKIPDFELLTVFRRLDNKGKGWIGANDVSQFVIDNGYEIDPRMLDVFISAIGIEK